MPVMHGKQSVPMDVILTQSCANSLAQLGEELWWQKSHTRDAIFMNPCFSAENSLKYSKNATARKHFEIICLWSKHLYKFDVFGSQLQCGLVGNFYSVWMAECLGACTLSLLCQHSGWQRAVSERTGQYYWLFVWHISPCHSVTPAKRQGL